MHLCGKAVLSSSLEALGLIAIGSALADGGHLHRDTDDAPGAALSGTLLMTGAVALAAGKWRRRRSRT